MSGRRIDRERSKGEEGEETESGVNERKENRQRVE